MKKCIVFVLICVFSSGMVFGDSGIGAEKMSWQKIDENFYYDGNDLGVSFLLGIPILKLWAPVAEQVSLILYDKYDQRREVFRVGMEKDAKGVWSKALNADLGAGISDFYGYFYSYEVKNPGLPAKRVLDPYAPSMAATTVSRDGKNAGESGDFVGKGAIILPEKHGKVKPIKKIKGYEKREDAIIYEVHVRDFTSDPSIGGRLRHRWGSFLALIDRLDYIKSLGVTHIQLLPVMAWYLGDETDTEQRDLSWSTESRNYNWGYDPQHYFTPTGAYSLKPKEPGARIEELKTLINAVHARGMGVILDVVYTHMFKADFLEDIVPNYYFFKDSAGNFIGDFGNNLATNRRMAEKLLVDSVRYWHEEFGIDGMRFDMMGDGTRDAVQRAYEAAAEVNANTLFIGEGWRTFKGHLDTPSLAGRGADQDWMAYTDRVGVFSDEIRNDLKSGFGCEGEPRFLTGGAQNLERLIKNLKGQPTNFVAYGPGSVVQYIEAHDNLPLFDVIAQSIKRDPAVAENVLEIHRRIRLGNLLVLTAQGIAFLHAGQEYGRTKQWLSEREPGDKYHVLVDEVGQRFKHPYFIHDSYRSSDMVNMFDWKKAAGRGVEADTVAFTKGLIKLRRSSDAFRLGGRALVEARVKQIKTREMADEDLVLGYSCEGSGGERFYVFVNADSQERVLSLDEDLSKGEVLVDGRSAGTRRIGRPKGVRVSQDKIVLAPLTATVIRLGQRR
jgi:pullulanase